MIRYIVLLLFSMHIASVYSQNLTPNVFNGTGTVGTNGDYYMSWTLGEVAINTHSRAEATLIQGFQQPAYVYPVWVNTPAKDYQVRLYPNPTPDLLIIEINGTEQSFTVEVFDLFGRQLFRQVVSAPQASIDLGKLTGGTYLLKILDGNHQIVGIWKIQLLW